MLDDRELKDIFDGLVGFSPVKPFECVGTVSEINFALWKLSDRYRTENREMPYLLKYFTENAAEYNGENPLNGYNPMNNVPDDFLFAVKEMYEDVAENG